MTCENIIPEPGSVTYSGIFWTFFRVGLFTLGGGLAMATVVRHELVFNRGWIKDEDFMAEMSTATLVPGAIAVNLAYLQGRRLRGWPGSALAVLGTILPSFVIILLIALFAFPYFANPRVEAFLRGCAIAVAGQIAFAAFIFGRRHLRSFKNAMLCAFGIVLVIFFKFHPVWAVVSAGIVGYFINEDKPEPVADSEVEKDSFEPGEEI